MAIQRYYQRDRNPEELAFPGVPLSDLDDVAWARIPNWLKPSVTAAWMHGGRMYRDTERTPPDPETYLPGDPPAEADEADYAPPEE